VLSVVLSCAFTALSLGGLVVVSTHIIDQTRAQIAADAAALGAVYGGESAVLDIALRNGAQVVSSATQDNGVHAVKVRVGRQYATAHARDSWAQQLPTMSP
jgi:NADPH-dependent curcumin reductase CurA